MDISLYFTYLKTSKYLSPELFKMTLCRSQCEAWDKEIQSVSCKLKETVHRTDQTQCKRFFRRDSSKTVRGFFVLHFYKVIQLIYFFCIIEMHYYAVHVNIWHHLTCRLKESDLKISLDKPAELARRTEKELFALFQGVDSKYKNKYRSLTFNLKDAKNNASILASTDNNKKILCEA